MSAHVEKAQRPFIICFPDLIRAAFGRDSFGFAKTHALQLTDLLALPRNSQLLLAYCLAQNSSDLMLLASDIDAVALLSAGWLVAVPCPTIGVVSLKFKPIVWRRLGILRWQFLTAELLRELGSYIKRKSSSYPWIW